MAWRRTMRRHALALLFAPLALACSQSHGTSGEGVCCPVTDFTGCSPGATPLPGGGWAPSLAECTYTIEGFDGWPYVRVTDAHGCARAQEDLTAAHCGTPSPIDGGTGSSDGGHAPADAGPIDCAGAHPISVVACDLAGCVPAYPAGTGDPDPTTATCVPVHPDICTYACFRVAPPCPTGTVPEGDGGCFTDRCIPAFVCE